MVAPTHACGLLMLFDDGTYGWRTLSTGTEAQCDRAAAAVPSTEVELERGGNPTGKAQEVMKIGGGKTVLEASVVVARLTEIPGAGGE